MTPTDSSIVADLDLRLDAPTREPKRLRVAVAAILALAIDAGALYLASRETQLSAPKQPEEIPVEVVVEPPPPPAPPPSPEATPTPAPKVETPPDQEFQRATDAPREGKSDHDDPVAADKPKPAETPPPPAPSPSPVETPPTPEPSPTPVETPAPTQPAPPAPTAAEAELPPPAPSPPAAPATTAPMPAPAKSFSAPMFASVPDIDFGGAAMKSPITGGNARSTYTSQLYGLISPRIRVPAIAHTFGRTLTGSIGFTVDGQGRLMQRYVAVASGSSELDEAVMQAIGNASRSFPRPPHGAPIGLVFTYSVN